MQDGNPGAVASGDWPTVQQKDIATGPRSLIYRDASGNIIIGDDSPDSYISMTFFEVLGTGARPEEFNGPAISSDRPSLRTHWEAINSGTFSIQKTSSHGQLVIETTNVTGSGGFVNFPFLGGHVFRPPVNNDKMFMMASASRQERMFIEVGFTGPNDRGAWLQVNTTDNGIGNWTAVTSSGGQRTEVDTGRVFRGTENIIVGVEFTSNDRYGSDAGINGFGVDFWLATEQGGIVRFARLNSLVPTQNVSPFVRVRLYEGVSAGTSKLYVNWLCPWMVG